MRARIAEKRYRKEKEDPSDGPVPDNLRRPDHVRNHVLRELACVLRPRIPGIFQRIHKSLHVLMLTLSRERILCYDAIAGWSSQVARWAHNPKVASSNLAPATNSLNWLRFLSALPPHQLLTDC